MMTSSDKQEWDKLDRVVDSLVDDILTMSDDEVIADVENGEDIRTFVAKARAIFEGVRTDLAREVLVEARNELENDEEPISSTIKLSPFDARRKLQQILTQHPQTLEKLTLAARKGQGLSDAEVISMLEDLEEIGVFKSASGESD